ncbi:MAG TPA: M48 family metallopeptidase [Candidatus Sulfotelmatobacter sp.]|jgi:predicted Zn-dependent protease|nr:M48 family metallopeptidase [Candidatus Sulfotelmatobacter sp.]
MKLRWLAGALALAFGAAPWMVAQTPGQDPQNQPGTQTPQTQTPQTQNPPSQSPQKAPPTTDPDDGQPKASDIQNAPKKAPAALPVQEDSQIKHDGGKTDVDAVGNRNVGCGRGVGNWYSVEKQVAMGRSFAQQVESQVKMVNDPVVTEYVNRIGQNLVRNSDAQVPFTIKVIDSDVVNAMALPGGFFYVNSGLILAADEEAEVAGVMAHEIAHVAACHAAREISRSNLMQLASIPLIFVGGGIGYAGYEAAGIAGMFGILKFSRGFEAEADYLGIEYMYRAGYDPSAFVSFFEKVQAMEKKKPGTLAKAFDTHPQSADRIQKSQDEIRKILPAKQQYVVTTSEFDEVKSRLAAIENKHKLLDEKDSSKPSLRRTSNPSDKSEDGKKDDDDRPTLKRRDDSN